MNYLCAFKSRSEAFRLRRALADSGIASTVINTPRKLGVSCGLSVVFDPRYEYKVRELVSSLVLKTFQGIFPK